MPKRSFAPPDSGPARPEPTPQSPPPAEVPPEPEAPATRVEPEPPREEAVREAPPVAERVVPPPVPPRPVVDARPHTASELTEYTIVRRRSDKPGSGGGRAVHVAGG